MELFDKTDSFTLYHGSMLDMTEVLKPKSIDSIVTDPPYELNFMNKGWDNSGIAFQKETWEKCFQVLKPGGYLLAFGGSRTFHRIAVAIENAGFEIRDTIMWLYGNGFPKSMNIGMAIEKKEGAERPEWDGWGTCLKPAYEPVIIARKPCEGSCIDNVLMYGVGGINLDECRIGEEYFVIKNGEYDNNENQSCFGNIKRTPKEYYGRFPANVILTYDDTDQEEVCGGMPNEDEESAARYFYCAKASKRDRDEGLEEFDNKIIAFVNQAQAEVKRGNINKEPTWNGLNNIKFRKNIHPTVKPTELMQYLVRLVTPRGGVVLDPFNGSGSTGKACMYENKDRQANYKYIGIELTAEYLPIAAARIRYAANDNKPIETQEKPLTGQITLDDLIGGIG